MVHAARIRTIFVAALGGLVALLLLLAVSANAFAATENGHIAFTRTINGHQQIVIADPNGAQAHLITLPHGAIGAMAPQWAPNPNTAELLYTAIFPLRKHDTRNPTKLYLYNALSGKSTELLGHDDFDGFGSWSPNGDEISFTSNANLYVMRADGSGAREIFNSSTDLVSTSAWSPTGNKIAFIAGRHLYTISPDGTTLVHIRSVGFPITSRPSWSPDGTHILLAVKPPGESVTHILDLSDLSDPFARGSVLDPNVDGNDISPQWSPKGDQVIFASDRETYVSGEPPKTFKLFVSQVQRIVHPDGSYGVVLGPAHAVTGITTNAAPAGMQEQFVSWQTIDPALGPAPQIFPVPAPPIVPGPPPPPLPLPEVVKPVPPKDQVPVKKPVPPIVKNLKVVPPKFGKKKIANIRFNLSLAAKRVQLRILRIGKGFGKKGRFFGTIPVKPNKTGFSANAGFNRIALKNIRFKGKVKRLVPGRYRLVFIATGPGNKSSKPMAVVFTVKK